MLEAFDGDFEGRRLNLRLGNWIVYRRYSLKLGSLRISIEKRERLDADTYLAGFLYSGTAIGMSSSSSFLIRPATSSTAMSSTLLPKGEMGADGAFAA